MEAEHLNQAGWMPVPCLVRPKVGARIPSSIPNEYYYIQLNVRSDEFCAMVRKQFGPNKADMSGFSQQRHRLRTTSLMNPPSDYEVSFLHPLVIVQAVTRFAL